MELIRNRKGIHKVLSVFITMLMLFGVFIPSPATTEADALSVTVTFDGATYSYNSSGGQPTENKHGMFSTNFGSGVVYCGEHGIPDAMGSTPGASASFAATEYSGSTVAKVLYYGYGGPEQWSGFANSKYNDVYRQFSGNAAKSKTEACGISVTSMALTKAYGQDGRVYDISGLDEFWSYISGKSAPKGFTVYKLKGSGGAQELFTWEYNPEIDVTVKVNKTSTNPDISNGNDCYSLSGAVFKIMAGGVSYGAMTTNASGVATKSISLPPDDAEKITVTEVTPPKGYALNSQSYTKNGSSGSVTFNVKDAPQNDPVGLMLGKVDAETTKNMPQGSASLENAEFTVKYYDGYYESEEELDALDATRTWVFKTDEYGTIFLDDPETYFIEAKSDDLYYDSTGAETFPLGTYVIQETKAPEGYLLNDEVFIRQVTGTGTGESVETYNPPNEDTAIKEQIRRGDLELVKVEAENQQRLANIPFLLTNEDTGEAHVIVTDENGYFNSANSQTPHSQKTNANDEAWDGETIDESKLDPAAGVWFGETSAIDATHGALFYGNYSLTELRCDANEGYDLVKNIKINISRDSYTVNIGTVSDNIVLLDTYISDTDFDREKTTLAREGVELTDRVDYKRLEANEEYRLEGVLVDKDTAEPITVDGKQVTAEKEFTAKKASGSEELVYEFDATGFEGKTVVSFVKVYRGDTLVGAHEDVEDPDQAMKFLDTKVDTTALDTKTDTHWALAEDEVTITDSITYDNLLGQYIYEVTGTVMNKETGEPLQYKGKDVSVTKKIEPNRGEGELEMEFTFDASDLEGKDVVVFQEFTIDGIRVAGHEDMNDADQTIHFPKVRTAAADSETDHRISYADNEVTIVDTVKYENVAPGVEHTAKGVLVDKETGKEIAKAEKTFTPDSKNGNVKVEFTFDGTDYAGKDVVIFEELYMENHLVGQHKDLQDLDQTINLPKVETEAVDKETGTKFSLADDSAIVVDTLKYTNVLVGEQYTAKASLIDKETEEVIGTSEKVFTAEHSNGTVDVEIAFDPSKYEGKDVVVFEQLIFEGHIVGTHEDLQDPDQTINVPKIRTQAHDSDTDIKMSLADNEVTVIDTVTYENLIPGEEYTIQGRLMDKEGKEAIAGDEVTFTAEKEDGEIELEFTFKGVDFEGKDVVVFETLWFEGKLIGQHTDYDDQDQTVKLPKVRTSAKDSDTEKKISNADSDITVIDTVTYENLVKGEKYTVKGSLVDKTTAKVITKAEKTFTAEEANGTVNIEFRFDGTKYAGKDAVVFEDIYYSGKLVGQHADINDPSQTINLPAVATKAKDKDTGKNAVIHKDGKTITIVDNVIYTNLLPGEEYKVTGVLMDKTTGKPVLDKDGKEITAEKTFTAAKENGNVQMEFKLDISELAGKDVVVFEKLWLDENIVGSHEDLNDESQTISIEKPEPKTGDQIPPYVIFAGIGLLVAIGAGTTVVVLKRRKNA